MWLPTLFLCLCCLARAQDSAAFRRSNDQAGRCHYTFSVASPQESSCVSGGTKAETDNILSRLVLLENLVSRLIASVDGSPGAEATTGDEALQEAFTQATEERNQLQQDKEDLNRQVQDLRRRLDEQVKEAEGLREKSCQQTQSLLERKQHQNQPARGERFFFYCQAPTAAEHGAGCRKASRDDRSDCSSAASGDWNLQRLPPL